MEDRMAFANRYGPWAVIMGASEGTGREFARQIAAEGIPSILIARRDAPLKALAEEIRSESGVECVTATIDLAALDAPEQVAAAVGDREIGLLVSNAGSDPNGAYFLDQPLAAWADLVQRNVMTVLKTVYHFAGPMKARGKGGLLLVNSGACYGGLTTMGPYCGSKAFTLCLAEALWAELKPFGVDVLTLVMSKTDTPEFRRYMAAKGMPLPADSAPADEVARIGLERLPFGPIKNWGEEDDETGMTNQSAAQRRERVVMIDKMTSAMFARS
jgi:short-subunit dehydrogenase